MDTHSFRQLPGLPGEGPALVQFSAHGGGTHREGFVVEFSLPDGEKWVGNFQPGLTSFSTVLPHPNGRSVVVIAGGQAYEVDVSSRSQLSTFGGMICDSIALPTRSMIIFSEGIDLRALQPTGFTWHTDRISWDGIRGLTAHGETLSGEAYDPMEDAWKPFTVALDSGKHTGGSYSEYRITPKA